MRTKNKNTKFILLAVITICFITAGYAAFDTSINLKAKGNIKNQTAAHKLKGLVVSTGDGLYKDETEEERYIYKGENPNNYIKLGSDLYRIISVEKDDTLKVIKNESIGDITFDPGYDNEIEGVTSANSNEGTRYSENSNDYCYFNKENALTDNYYGCNVWGSINTMLDAKGNNIDKISKDTTDTVYNLPEKEAYINTYLNSTWINSLSSNVQKLIDTHYFNVGPSSVYVGTLNDKVNYEKRYKWQGKIGLMNYTDAIKASNNNACSGSASEVYKSTNCLDSNYLYSTFGELTRTITPSITISNAYDILTVHGLGWGRALGPDGAKNKRKIAPVFYLKKDIQIKGKGTLNAPYEIEN